MKRHQTVESTAEYLHINVRQVRLREHRQNRAMVRVHRLGQEEEQWKRKSRKKDDVQVAIESSDVICNRRANRKQRYPFYKYIVLLDPCPRLQQRCVRAERKKFCTKYKYSVHCVVQSSRTARPILYLAVRTCSHRLLRPRSLHPEPFVKARKVAYRHSIGLPIGFPNRERFSTNQPTESEKGPFLTSHCASGESQGKNKKEEEKHQSQHILLPTSESRSPLE